MAMQSKSVEYEAILKLAESGRHDQALEAFENYLREHPDDGQAWNDSGAVLYCTGDVHKAIVHFEKARKLMGETPDSAEVFWNLTEAALDANQPRLAAQQFESLSRFGILHADTINRTANSFLQNEDFANAVEMLLKSLELSPEQEIIPPMIKVIRSHRSSVVIFGDRIRPGLASLLPSLEKRFVVHPHIDPPVYDIREHLENADIAIFDGISSSFTQSQILEKLGFVILRLEREDIISERTQSVDFKRVDALILPKTISAESIPGLDLKVCDSLKVIYTRIDASVDSGVCENKQGGKKLACLGPFTAQNNPALLIQAMQKLNYIDPDYRLYLMGDFEQPWLRDYTLNMIDTLKLNNGVMLDTQVNDLQTWLSEKHYIVSTCLTDQAIEGVLLGMSLGLKPVVHKFRGVEQVLDSEFVFTIAEQFCEQVTSGSYDPKRYHEIARAGRESNFSAVNNVLCSFERQKLALKRLERKQNELLGIPDESDSPHVDRTEALPTQQDQVQAPQAEVSESRPVNVIKIPQIGAEQLPDTPAPIIPQNEVQTPQSQPSGKSSENPLETLEVIGHRHKAMPIEPVKPDFSNPVEIPMPQKGHAGQITQEISDSKAPSQAPAVSGHDEDLQQQKGRIDRIASAALEASKTLMRLAQKNAEDVQSQEWNPENLAESQLAHSGEADLDESIRQKKIQKTVEEFTSSPDGKPGFTKQQDTSVPFLKL